MTDDSDVRLGPPGEVAPSGLPSTKAPVPSAHVCAKEAAGPFPRGRGHVISVREALTQANKYPGFSIYRWVLAPAILQQGHDGEFSTPSFLLHLFFGIYFREWLPLSLMYSYLQSLFQSRWTHGYSFHSLGPEPIIPLLSASILHPAKTSCTNGGKIKVFPDSRTQNLSPTNWQSGLFPRKPPGRKRDGSHAAQERRRGWPRRAASRHESTDRRRGGRMSGGFKVCVGFTSTALVAEKEGEELVFRCCRRNHHKPRGLKQKESAISAFLGPRPGARPGPPRGPSRGRSQGPASLGSRLQALGQSPRPSSCPSRQSSGPRPRRAGIPVASCSGSPPGSPSRSPPPPAGYARPVLPP